MKKIFAVMLIIFCSACSEFHLKDDFFAMDTYMTAEIYGTENDVKAVREEIFRIDNLLRPADVDTDNAEVKKLIVESERLTAYTNGTFDIYVASYLELWGFRSKEYKIPTDNEIEKAGDIKSVDFGGIGKGYAGMKIRDILKSRGVESAVVSLGGNVQTVGSKPDGRPWKVGIRNPDGEGYLGFVEVRDCAVVTSGGYERFFETDGKKYSHIINPFTGRPAESDIKSVTVISENGALADALSTAFYVMGREQTIDFCDKNQFRYSNDSYSVVLTDCVNNTECLGDIEYTAN